MGRLAKFQMADEEIKTEIIIAKEMKKKLEEA